MKTGNKNQMIIEDIEFDDEGNPFPIYKNVEETDCNIKKILIKHYISKKKSNKILKS